MRCQTCGSAVLGILGCEKCGDVDPTGLRGMRQPFGRPEINEAVGRVPLQELPIAERVKLDRLTKQAEEG